MATKAAAVLGAELVAAAVCGAELLYPASRADLFTFSDQPISSVTAQGLPANTRTGVARTG